MDDRHKAARRKHVARNGRAVCWVIELPILWVHIARIVYVLMNQAERLGELGVYRRPVHRIEVRAARQQFAKVSRPHQGRRNGNEVCVLGKYLAEGLVISKPKQLVLDDRSTNREARLVSVERRIRGRTCT